ncbi:MAG TPA: thiamine pyrophosphate-binding protein [Sphingobium sp.]
MAVPVYERILQLFEVEGIKVLFGIPDPNFVHFFLEAEVRGWTVVAPHHEAAGGFMAEAASRITGKPAVAIGTLGPGLATSCLRSSAARSRIRRSYSWVASAPVSSSSASAVAASSSCASRH